VEVMTRRGNVTPEECLVADIDGNETWIPTSLLRLRRTEEEPEEEPAFPNIFADV
jgi:hypothetical protein